MSDKKKKDSTVLSKPRLRKGVEEVAERKLVDARIVRLTKLYAVLSRVNEAIVRTHDEKTLYNEVCKIVVEEGEFPLAWIGQVDEGRVAPAASSGPDVGYLQKIRVEVNGELGKGPSGTCIREDRPVVNDDFDINPLTAPWREPALRYGFRASAAFPLHRREKVIGALTLYSTEPHVFDDEQVNLLQALAADISYALDAIQEERLRAEAEEALKKSEEELRRSHDKLEMRIQERTAELKKTVDVLHDEIQERKKAEDALRVSEQKYRSLIEQAADAIVILDRKLNLVDVNTTACEMTGFTRDELLKLNALELYHQDELGVRPLRLDEVLAGETVITERKVKKRDGTFIDVEVSAKLLEDGLVQAIVRDITERKTEERRSHLITELLELFAKKTSRKEYLDSVVESLHGWTGCSHVGIRVVNKERYVPYISYRGFSEEFMRRENMLSLDSDTCACIRVIAGNFETQDASAITTAGSFRLDDSIKFEKQLTKKELARFRGNCMRSGYATLAIIPVRYHDRPMGAIHLADEREGLATLNTVRFIESTAAPLIGEALYRFSTEEELERHRDNLEDLVKARTEQLQKTNEYLGNEIATRRQTEDELKQLTEELKRSNADLQQFAYAASHDLQEPLRVVAGFVKLLEKRYKDELDEKASEYIDFTVDGVKRMQMLIHDLLEFSRVGTKGKISKPTNCSVALEEALYNLHLSIEENKAEVTYDLLPTVMGDHSQLSRLFQNLISNAIKFRSEESPKIHISAEQKGREWLFSVRDNGMGIDQKYFNRIFVIFQRLHTREEYEGTGIGLSICKKIVEHHNGRIWVESGVGKGSTFFFTIPLKE